jgi:DNA-binding transcriptional LysR family regulator
MSQPAMSRALARLREVLGDPLLVRRGAGYLLSPRAVELAPRLAGAMGQVRDLFQPPDFDLASERRTIRIAASDFHTILLAPPIMARLAKEAPGIDLRMEPLASGLISRMESGTLDLAFAASNTPLPPGALSEPLAQDRLAVVLRRGHPAAGRPFVAADYAAFDHVGVSILGDGISELDAWLAGQGVRRRMALVTPHFIAALAAVSQTDLVTTLTRAFASRFADHFDLVLQEPPFAEASLGMTLVWAHVRASDPVLSWIRGVVREAALQLDQA